MNIIFDLIINNNVISKSENNLNSLLIPTLKISDKTLFDNLLVEYVMKALNYYNKSEFSFLDDLDNENIENIDNVKGAYCIKYIICTLLANASFADFNAPIDFLESRIAMFDNKIIESDEEINIGYIDSIGANLFVKEEKSPIRSETPYRIKSKLLFDDGYVLNVPDIYSAFDGEKYYLYGIQGEPNSNKEEEKKYLKQIRKGFIAKINGAPEHYFLAVMLFLSLCSDKKIKCVPFLVERWNAKSINIDNISKVKNIDVEEKINEQEYMQGNITNKLIQYFTKLYDVCNGLIFESVPFELDDRLHIYMDTNFESRSAAFNEIFNLASKNKNGNFKL